MSAPRARSASSSGQTRRASSRGAGVGSRRFLRRRFEGVERGVALLPGPVRRIEAPRLAGREQQLVQHHVVLENRVGRGKLRAQAQHAVARAGEHRLGAGDEALLLGRARCEEGEERRAPREELLEAAVGEVEEIPDRRQRHQQPLEELAREAAGAGGAGAAGEEREGAAEGIARKGGPQRAPARSGLAERRGEGVAFECRPGRGLAARASERAGELDRREAAEQGSDEAQQQPRLGRRGSAHHAAAGLGELREGAGARGIARRLLAGHEHDAAPGARVGER